MFLNNSSEPLWVAVKGDRQQQIQDRQFSSSENTVLCKNLIKKCWVYIILFSYGVLFALSGNYPTYLEQISVYGLFLLFFKNYYYFNITLAQ